jgi:Ca-activated chloride channel family protein
MTVATLGPVSLSGWQHPMFLALLALPPALLCGYAWVQVRRRQRLSRFADRARWDTVRPRPPTAGRHLPMLLMMSAVTALVVAIACPTTEIRKPQNRAVVMVAIDVSQSMQATDEDPTRLEAAKRAVARFATHLTVGVNLGLICFAGTSSVLVSPTPDHQATVDAVDHLTPQDSTAIGAAIFAGLDAVRTVAAVLAAPKSAAPARIVLLSDGAENKPSDPDAPKGAYTAARSAHDAGIPVSTIAFGTAGGRVKLGDTMVAVPVDDVMLQRIAELSGGQFFRASSGADLDSSYAAVADQFGYVSSRGPADVAWLRLTVLFATAATILALVLNRRVPT